MPSREYAHLELRQSITTRAGHETRDIVVMRPTTRDMMEILDTKGLMAQTGRFVERLVRARANGHAPAEFDADQIDTADASELNALLVEMLADGDGVPVGSGDGINEPITYTLQRPITLNDAGDTISQIQFQARRMRDVTDYLDAPAGQDFLAFMRGFGQLLGTKLPMSDSIINALDYVDYLTIRRKIVGKLTGPRRKWTRL